MTTHLLQSVSATAAHHRPMYFVALKKPCTDDPRQARGFTREEAETIQKNTAGWLTAVRRPKSKTWGAKQ